MNSLKIQRKTDRNLGTQLRESMLSKIKSGEWPPGTKLPSIRVLESDTGISIGVVRKVISELANDGYLRQHQGKGVFVAQPLNGFNNVAVVLPDICSEHITYILRGIKAELDKYNTGLLLESARNDFSEEIKLVDKLDKGTIAGAIIYPPPLRSFTSNLTELKKRKIPFVLINTAFDREVFSNISVDYFKMGQIAISHLVERGHKKIGILGYKIDVPSFNDLYNGMEHKLNDYGLCLNDMPKIVLDYPRLNPSPFTNPQGTVMELLEKNPDMTAILSTGENTAVEAYLSMKKAGIKIPDDISLITLGDMAAFNITTPAITAITQPYEEIGRLSVQSLFNLFSIQRNEPSSLIVKPLLLERESVKDIS